MRIELAEECKSPSVGQFRTESGEVAFLGSVGEGGTIEVEKVGRGCEYSGNVFGETDEGGKEGC